MLLEAYLRNEVRSLTDLNVGYNTPNDTFETLTSGEVERSFQTFIYDRNFSYPPSPTTDRYWRGLFPEGGGFFNHPTLPSTLSTISVLHQLHCLVMILFRSIVIHD